MRINREQRVGVFVDVQNMYYSAKNLYDAKVNFANILRQAVSGRRLVRAITYVIKADIKEERNFFVPLVEHLRRALGCRIEVIAFGKSCSGKLMEEADQFIDMDKDKRRFLI